MFLIAINSLKLNALR